MELTRGQQKVLYGLLRFPHLNDVELAKKLGLSRVTVTCSKNRLKKGGIIHEQMVPDFEMAGFEIMTTLYGYFKPRGKILKGAGQELRRDFSNAFYMLRSGGHHLSLGVAKSLTHFRKHLVEHHRMNHKSGFLTDKRHNFVLFPLKHTFIHRFFDYSHLIARHFGLKQIPEDENKREKAVWKPTNAKMRALMSFVKNPSATDSQIADDSGLARQTVNQFRKSFISQGIIRPLMVADMSKLGYSVTAFNHMHLNPNIPENKRKSALKKALEDPSHILKVAADLEAVSISVHKDEQSFRNSQKTMQDIYMREKILLEPPNTVVYRTDGSGLMFQNTYRGMGD